jgi:tRNA uridine 5-carboxymethylaminomethyl modification enzyme
MKYGYDFGLIPKKYYDRLTIKENLINFLKDFLEKNWITPKVINQYLESINEQPLNQPDKLSQIVKRNHTDIIKVLECYGEKSNETLTHAMNDIEVLRQVEIELRYAGYINAEMELINQFIKNESIIIPPELDYSLIKTLSTEGREKLKRVHPISIGQASRISGVTPADITTLLMYLKN